jgi:transcriptional regulator with PAS, ATPase and Fis domain
LVAQAIHKESGRKGALIAFSVAALSESLFESELFGHVRGAFTGAIHARPGLLRKAHNGTAFFDEIGELSLAMQAKLLRAIESGKFLPVGSETEVSTNFRLVAATNIPLREAVKNEEFRGDLWYRLRGTTIHVPPLRDHPEDIPELVRHFLLKFQQESVALPGAITDHAISRLQQYAWPGNVRELRQVIQVLMIYSRTSVITEQDVALLLAELNDPEQTEETRRLQHRSKLLSVLQDHQGNINAAATALGINRSTLYRQLKRLGIRTPRTSMKGR